MKINALFIENKSNLGNPQFAGYVETFDDVAELCAYALPNFFTDKTACKAFAIKLRECFDARGDEEGFFDSILKTNLYGWANTWKISKNEITIYVMKNLFSLDALKPSSGIGESLNKLEEQEIRDTVQDWLDEHYDDYDSQDREDLLDDVNYNAEMYLDMLEDTCLEKSTNEKRDVAYDILKEIVENKTSLKESNDSIGKSSTLNEDNVPECWKIFIVFRDGDNDYARTYSKKIQVFHSKEEAERKAKEIKAQTPEVKTVLVCKFNGWEGKYEFADKN